MTTVVFDYDIHIYRIGFAVEKKDEEGIIKVEPIENAYHSFNISVRKVLEKYGTNDFHGFLSKGPGFRAGISTTRVYKGNREAQHKPFYYAELRAYAKERLGGEFVEHIEADDACATSLTALGEGGVLCSIDKDLLQIPGRHYNWIRETEQVVDKRIGILNFYKQMIQGDSTDNIEGIPGKGPKAAEQILSEAKSSEEAERKVWQAYQEAFKEKAWEKFLEMGRLCYILRTQHEIEAARAGYYWRPKYVTRD
jgi:hypothetical protein